MREFTVGENDAGQRLDRFAAKAAANMPMSMLYKAVRTKKIKVNRKRAEINQRLEAGDTVQMFVPEDVFSEAVSAAELLSAPDTVNVVYEDGNILICDKPAGMLSHSGELDASPSSERGTLIYGVWSYLCKTGAYDPAAENTFRPALANRIDRNTRGIVIAAKTAAALRGLNALIRGRLVDKYYLCAAHGKFAKPSDTLAAYLKKDAGSNTVRIYGTPAEGTSRISTAYRVLAYNGELDLSLAEVRLITGKTHQIRAHFEYIGHPLLGEGKYGATDGDAALGYRSQALCSFRVNFSDGDWGADAPELRYLAGRSFSLSPGEVGFLSLFDGGAVGCYLATL